MSVRDVIAKSADCASILERLEKATGPDREMDGLIAKFARELPDCARYEAENIWRQETNQWISGGWGSYEFYEPEAYTASLDAAIALVERQGFAWLKKSFDPEVMTVVRPLTPEQDARKEWAVHHEALGATPAIALLIALFRALRSQDEEER